MAPKTMTPSSLPLRPLRPAATADAGRVRLGAGLRRQGAAVVTAGPLATPASVRDSGRVRLGAGLRRF